MGTLHDRLQRDINKFLNNRHFSETRYITFASGDCYPVNCQLASDKMEGATAKINTGIYANVWTLYCAAADLPYIPITGESIHIDDKLFIVESSDDQSGMLVLKLSAIEA
jgi:hypothetical protein